MKLAAPVSVPGLLPRADVVTQLIEAPQRVWLLSAPAGWGKTSLLAAWRDAEQGRRPFAFLRLEDGDDSGPVFWSYLIAALRTVHPGLVAGVDELLRGPEVDPIDRIAPLLLNELAEIDQPMVLVLDDYHVITRDEVHHSVAHIIDHLPSSLQLVIATRSDPPLSLVRLRASGDLAEIRAGSLGFSEEEAAAFLSRRFAVDLDRADIQVLCHRTEGWPAALQLAGLSLQGAQDRKEFVHRFAGDDRNVADYLTGEVLEEVSSADREFLLHTSVLDQLTGPLCDAVAGVTDAASILDRMERKGLFLIPLDNRRRWYRYHHLFADWLRHELQKTDPVRSSDLHLKASRWHAAEGSLESAVAHAIAARDSNTAACLIDQYLCDWSQAHWSRLSQWFSQLPDDAIRAYPLTAAAKCRLALARGDFSAGLGWIDAAAAAMDTAPIDQRPTIETTVSLYRAFGELVAGDIDVARALSEEIADRERPTRSSNYALAVGLAGISTFWATGALEAIPLLHEGSLTRRQALLSDSGVTALLAAAYAEIGDWTAAESAAADAFGLPDPPPWNRYPDRMAAHYALGKVLIARGDREQGITRIQEGLVLARAWVEPIFIAYGCLALADASRNFSEKRALVREARQLVGGLQGRGRVIDLVAAAEKRLSMRRPPHRTAGTVHVEALTERELDVLRLLRSDLSLREIASELYISHNTIKSYTKSIYRKLGVTSRAAALDAAAELDAR
jgi:LuxR family maltose regulon positive regulatory protein